MKEIWKMIRIDKVFLVIVLLLMLAGGLLISLKTIAEMRCAAIWEEDDREYIADNNEKYGFQDTYEEVYKENLKGIVTQNEWGINDGRENQSACGVGVFPAGYQQLAIWMGLVLFAGFWAKWLLQERERKIEFWDCLPVKRRSRSIAQMVEMAVLTAVTTLCCTLYLQHKHHVLLERFPKADYCLNRTFPTGRHWSMALTAWVSVMFLLLLLQFLHVTVGRLWLLPILWGMGSVFFPLMTNAGFVLGSSLNTIKIHTVSELAYKTPWYWYMDLSAYRDSLYMTELYPWNFFLLFRGNDSVSRKMTVFLLILNVVLFLAICFLSGKRDSSGKRWILYRPLEAVALLALFVELTAMGAMNLAGVTGKGAGIAIAAVFVIVLICAVWYLADGRYRVREVK